MSFRLVREPGKESLLAIHGIGDLRSFIFSVNSIEIETQFKYNQVGFHNRITRCHCRAVSIRRNYQIVEAEYSHAIVTRILDIRSKIMSYSETYGRRIFHFIFR